MHQANLLSVKSGVTHSWFPPACWIYFRITDHGIMSFEVSFFLLSVWKLWCNPSLLSLALWAVESSGSCHHPRQGFLALSISNLLFRMWSYLSFDTFWCYWKTNYLGRTLDSSQGFFPHKLLKFTVQRLMSCSARVHRVEGDGSPHYQVEESYLLGKAVLPRKLSSLKTSR